MTDLKHFKMLIDGDWVDASDGALFESLDPTTGKVWAMIPEATADDVDRAVQAADRALNHGPWSTMTATQRGQCLRKLGDLLVDKAEAFGRVETIDTGKLLRETQWQAKYVAEFFHFFAGCADKINGETLPIDKPDMFVFTRREPLGVIAAVVPWNSQLFLSAVKIGPALAAGNTVVLKVSEHASAPMLEFGLLIAAAGIPPGVVNIICGHGDPCGRVLTSHKRVARVSFTGGPGAARQILTNAANNFAQVSLELGGKSPVIVFDDANLESAANTAISAIFGATGQSCVAGSRLLLQDTIADAFLDRMVGLAAQIRIGDPLASDTEMGPLCTQAQLECVEREVARAIAEGGRVLCGGSRVAGLAGRFYHPTIIDCPRPDLHILDTEMFGPVLSVLRFTDEAEAIRLANQTEHGLAAGIFTRDGARQLRMVKAVKAGIVWVNTYRAVSPIAEFGGMKSSGYGRESGLQAVYDYTRPKTVWINTADATLGSQFVGR